MGRIINVNVFDFLEFRTNDFVDWEQTKANINAWVEKNLPDSELVEKALTSSDLFLLLGKKMMNPGVKRRYVRKQKGR